ncbi:MAG: hypothetical protein V3S48_05900 [Candidatus Neomarinimicrobiota bacterium]
MVIRKYCCSLVLLVSLLSGESYWVSYGWQLFRNVGDAKSIALGGFQPAQVGTAVAPLYNPAASIIVGEHSLTYAHQSRLGGMINSDLLGFTIKPRFRPLNIIFLYEGIGHIPDTKNMLFDFGLDGIPGTGDEGENNGILDEGERLDQTRIEFFSQNQWGLHISSAIQMQKWIIGLGVKGFSHNIGHNQGLGIGMDLGFMLIPWSGGRIGITFKDITTSWLIWDNGTIEREKPEVYAGLSQIVNLKSIPVSIKYLGSFEINPFGLHPDEDFDLVEMGITLRLGLNISYKDKIALRLGRNRQGSATGGLGLIWDNYGLDYAFQSEPSGSGLGGSHYISFAVSPDWLKKLIDSLD